MRASQPALLAAARVITESRDEMVAQWLDRLGDRVAAAPTIARPTVEREFRLIIDVLAEMVGTTRSRVNFFMNKFRKLGFIDYNGALKVNNSLLGVVLRD